MKQENNILVFPGGTEIGLEVHRALRYHKDINLFSAHSYTLNHSLFIYKNNFTLPLITEPNFIEELNKLIRICKIDFIYPAYDDVIEFLAIHSDRINAKIISSPLNTCKWTRYKKETYVRLHDKSYCPKVYTIETAPFPFPCFIKPNKGQGGHKSFVCETKEKMLGIMKYNPDIDFVITDYFPGKEYTVDCFSDREEGFLFSLARERIRIINGICITGTIAGEEKQDCLRRIAKEIHGRFNFYGAWFFQVKEDKNGDFKLLEVSSRIAGTSAITRGYGVNLPLLSIYEALRIPIKIKPNNIPIIIDRPLINRYAMGLEYHYIYIDLDDTIILKGKVNKFVMMFLYQCQNNGIDILLLTRNKNARDLLDKFSIKESLFRQIIYVSENEKKKDFIKLDSSIFIDDSFKEKEDVSVPCFGVDQMEMLMDWKS